MTWLCNPAGLTALYFAHRIASELQDGLKDKWSDMVCFYLGCSFGFEGKLKNAGVPVRNVEQGTNVSMYRVRCRYLQRSCMSDYRKLGETKTTPRCKIYASVLCVLWFCESGIMMKTYKKLMEISFTFKWHGTELVTMQHDQKYFKVLQFSHF